MGLHKRLQHAVIGHTHNTTTFLHVSQTAVIKGNFKWGLDKNRKLTNNK